MARRFFADFTIAPILEISSGRPFNILTGIDQNLDLQSSNERPSVAADGTLVLPTFLTDGSLGRNQGITHSYASLDLRVMRSIRVGERLRLDLIAEGFNLFNRFNEAAANPFFDVVNTFGQRERRHATTASPTAAYDPTAVPVWRQAELLDLVRQRNCSRASGRCFTAPAAFLLPPR